MKKKPLISGQLIIISALFLILATSCKKSNENDPSVIKDGDGNTYTSVTIGTQVWLVENLKTTKFNNGADIPLVTGNSDWESLSSPGYCWYENDISKKTPYGALYNWYAANNGKLCPKGWHVPTDAEWTALTDYVGGASIAGLKLKATSGWNSGGNGHDNYGFSALPGGYRSGYNGSFYYGRLRRLVE
jgi:uncharacterized protein (TIGR02145 family)